MQPSKPLRTSLLLIALTISGFITTGGAAAEAETSSDTAAPASPASDEATDGATDAPAPPPDPQLDALLDRIDAAAAAVTTLSARLRYDRHQELLDDRQRRFGTFRYAAGPPEKFDARFDKLLIDGKARRIDLRYTFDGHWLAERNQEDRTFVRRELVAESAPADHPDALALGQSPFAVPLGARKAELLARFAIAMARPADDDPPGSLHLVLTPLPGQRTDQQRLDLWYDAETLLPVRVASLDHSGNRSIIDLLKIKVNPDLDDSAFHTTAPRGGGWSITEQPIDP